MSIGVIRIIPEYPRPIIKIRIFEEINSKANVSAIRLPITGIER
jgi:hypothetical protein